MIPKSTYLTEYSISTIFLPEYFFSDERILSFTNMMRKITLNQKLSYKSDCHTQEFDQESEFSIYQEFSSWDSRV